MSESTPDPKRIHRLLRLLTLLQGGRRLDATQLQDELGVSRRTLFRDLNALRAADIPLVHRRGKGYRISASYYLPPISLNAREVLGLMILARQATGRRNRPLFGEALSAIYKLIGAVPEPLRSVCAELVDQVHADPGPIFEQADDNTQSHFLVLQESISKRRPCRFVYQTPTDEGRVEGELHPLLLHEANRAWYIFARTSHAAHGSNASASSAPASHNPAKATKTPKRGGKRDHPPGANHWPVRMFKLVRFQSVEPIPQAPAFDRPSHFSPTDVLGKAWRFIPAGREYDIELDFEPKVATNVAEVRWHESQSTQWLADGRLRVRFRVDGLDEITWWLSGYGDQVRVRKPAALRRKLHDMHQRAAERNR